MDKRNRPYKQCDHLQQEREGEMEGGKERRGGAAEKGCLFHQQRRESYGSDGGVKRVRGKKKRWSLMEDERVVEEASGQ